MAPPSDAEEMRHRVQTLTELAAAFRPNDPSIHVRSLGRLTQNIPIADLIDICDELICEKETLPWPGNLVAVVRGKWRLREADRERRRQAEEDAKIARIAEVRTPPSEETIRKARAAFRVRHAGRLPSEAEIRREAERQKAELRRAMGDG